MFVNLQAGAKWQAEGIFVNLEPSERLKGSWSIYDLERSERLNPAIRGVFFSADARKNMLCFFDAQRQTKGLKKSFNRKGAAFSIFYFNFSGSHARAKNTACFFSRRRVKGSLQLITLIETRGLKDSDRPTI